MTLVKNLVRKLELKQKKTSALSALTAFTMTTVLMSVSFEARGADLQSQQQKRPSQTILLGVDGFSYWAFVAAQKAGLFAEFKSSGAHVAPFPSMTDLSWSTMTHTAELFGPAGRIKSVEATYFDDSTQSVQGDPRDYYRRLAFPKYYMGAFDVFFNPYIEGLMYFPTEEVPKLEIRSVIDELISAKPKPVITGYIGAADSIAHTQLNRLFPVLRTLDSEIKRLIEAYKNQGRDVEVILVSDHGNIGRFAESEPEQELLGVDIAKETEAAGFNWVQQLKTEKDVAMPLLALGNWGPMYVKDRSQIPNIIASFRQRDWFDLAVTLNKNNNGETIMTVYSNSGEAQLQFNKAKGIYRYSPVQGNALGISLRYQNVDIQSSEVFTAAVNTPYPDSIFRLIESASEQNFDFPDLILCVHDGYYLKSALGAFTKMYRTHGSLSASSSFGLIASTGRKVPGQIRTKDIFPKLGIDPKDLFGQTLTKHLSSGNTSLNEVLKNSKIGIETDARNFEQKRIFRHITKFVADTRPYFVVSEMQSFMNAFKFDPFKSNSGQGLSPLNFDISKFDVTSMVSTDDVGKIADAVLSTGSVEKILQDPRIQEIQAKMSKMQSAKQSRVDLQQITTESDSSVFESLKNYLLPLKRTAMKMYQMPFLLETSIVVQEKPYLPETRDLVFAQKWLNSKDTLVKSFDGLNRSQSSGQSNAQSTDQANNTVQELFKQTINESDLEGRIYPTQLTKIYNQSLENVTLVYVPGIYNRIFDQEIFSLGLDALTDELGLRLIQAPVESTCSSDYNAELIAKFLRKDILDRQARGHAAPKYIFLSYSKGAVDTLQFLIKNKSFTANFVKAMVSIASPLHGSQILNTTDLPFTLVGALTENANPAICQKEQPASKSVTPLAMETFWRRNEKSLVGLTRYLSVTFASTPEDSHIFMKATKIIGQFDEDNDGVVTVSSSKFPKSLHAVDLGTIAADHLSGVLSSRFNQKAFFKGLVRTLAELKITDDYNNLKWNTEAVVALANQNVLKQGSYFQMKEPGVIRRLSWKSNDVYEIQTGSTAFELNAKLIPATNDPADNYEPKIKLPTSQLKYDPYSVLDVQKLPDIMSGTRVAPATRQNMPDGIILDYHHKNMVHFRMDHQLNYESRSPLGADDNKDSGYITSEFNGEADWVAMRSQSNSIRLTTLAYRFSPIEFSNMSLKLAVTKDATGADPVKGKTGKDDSPFQLWLTIRDGRANADRSLVDPKNDKVFLFGYYYAGPVPNENRAQGSIFENWYSNKNVVVATLPEAKELLLNEPDMLGKAQLYKRNLAEDLRQAFPDRKVEDMEVVAITLQHDSNDTKSSTEAFFKSLIFAPSAKTQQ